MSQATLDDFDFSGSEGAQVAEASNQGGGFEREVQFLTLKADPASIQQGKHQAIVRLVTEYERKPWMPTKGTGGPSDNWATNAFNFAWITVAQHYARTKQRPAYAREGAQWPEKMFAVCRKDKVFAKRYAVNGQPQCYICDTIQNKAGDRTWALGIEREQIIENGRVVGMKDKTREVLVFDDNGEPVVERMDGDKKVYAKKTVPAWVVLNFGWKNFFNALSGQGQWNKTILDRDFVVQRTGTGNNDTNYTFIALDPITLGENPWGVDPNSRYDMGLIVGQEEGTGRPIPLMEAIYPEMPDLRRIIAERTSEDYFGRWFQDGWFPEGFDASKVQQQSSGGYGGYQPTGGYQPMQGGQQSGVGYTPPQGGQNGYQQPQGGGQQQPTFQQPQQPQPAPQSPQPSQGQAPMAGGLDALKARVLSGTGQPSEPQPEGQDQGSQQPAASQ